MSARVDLSTKADLEWECCHSFGKSSKPAQAQNASHGMIKGRLVRERTQHRFRQRPWLLICCEPGPVHPCKRQAQTSGL